MIGVFNSGFGGIDYSKIFFGKTSGSLMIRLNLKLWAQNF